MQVAAPAPADRRYHLASRVAPSARGDLAVRGLDIISGRLRLVVEVPQHRVERRPAARHIAGLAAPAVGRSAHCGLEDRGHLSIQGERPCGLLSAVTRWGQQFGLELRGKAPRPRDKGRLCVWAERRRRFGPRGGRLADQGEELFLACWCTHAQQP